MKEYWCLFCGEDGVKFKTVDELTLHMLRPHRDKNGGLLISRDSDSEDVVQN